MAMANPSYYQSGAVGQVIQQKEHLLVIYLDNNSTTRKAIVTPDASTGYGQLVVNDWEIKDGPGATANVIGFVSGLTTGTKAGMWICFNLAFNDKRFKGSSLKLLGNIGESGLLDSGEESAIVGGTGEFAGAQGVATLKIGLPSVNGRIYELRIRAFSLDTSPQPSLPAIKFGPSGGKGGDAFEIKETPQRLVSVTIRSGDVVDSLQFSYLDQAGKTQSAGPWGGNGGLSETILLQSSETIKKIFVTTGNFGGPTVVTSLRIVTNVTTYGPFGKGNGPSISLPDKDNINVLGFFGRSGLFLDAIGVYAN